MKRMLILPQCMGLKSMLTDLAYELRILMFLVATVLALSVLKIGYHHLCNNCHVKKIKHLLETRRPWRSGDMASSLAVSPLPKIERVPGCLSLRRRSSVQSETTESIEKLQNVMPGSPPSRSCTKSSTGERAQTSPHRHKNQIIASEILL